MILFCILTFLLLVSASCSASETALFSLSTMKVKGFKYDPDKRKRLVSSLLANPGDLLVTILILNTAVNILVQNVVSTIFGDYSGWFLNVGVPLVLTLICGEVIPKSISFANNEAIAYRVAPAMNVMKNLLLPIRRFLTSVTSIVSHLIFFFLKKEKEISIDELQYALKTSRQFGVLNEDEAEIVRGYLQLQESHVKELMRPREEVIFFDVEEPLSKLLHLFVDQECSRIPICRGELDQILGILTSRTVFLHRAKLQKTEDVLPYLEKAFFVPETISAEVLIRQMYQKKESIAMAVDEYGSVSGLISLEDLVETVVGEIADLRDEKARFTPAGQDVIIASGKLEIAELETLFDTEFKSENHMVTIGGWLTEQLGDIPKSGAKFTSGDFFFHVLAADPNRVRRVYIRRLKKKKS